MGGSSYLAVPRWNRGPARMAAPLERLAVGFLAILVVSCRMVPGAEIKGDLTLFELLAASYRSNVEQLETWQGEIVVTSAYAARNADQPQKRASRAVLSYLYHVPTSRARWEIVPTSVQLGDGKGRGEQLPPVARYLQVDGELYELFVHEGSARNRANKRAAAGVRPEIGGSGIYCVLTWLIGYPGSTDEMAEFWLSHAHESQGELTLSRSADALLVRHVAMEGGYIDEQTFDLARGGLMTAARFARDLPLEKLELKIQVEIVRRGGVWVPNTVLVEDDRRIPEDSRLRYEMRWRSNAVNRHVPPEEFTLAAIGLRPGDWVTDARTGARSRYEGEAAPVPPRELARDAPPAGRSPWRHAAWALAAVVAGGAVWWLFRRRRRADPSGTPPPG